MSAADWYAKKLGGGGTQIATRPSTPHVEQMLTRHAPPGYDPSAAQAVAYQQGEEMALDDAPPGQMHVMDAVVRWRGGKGTKTETHHCPNCGPSCPQCKGRQFFTRKEGSKMTANGPVAPAPFCTCCGYNGVYEPFGGALNSTV